MKKLIDANIIIRFLVWDDEKNFLKAKKIFSQIENEEIQVKILSWVILEVFFILTKFYEIEKKEVIKYLKQIMYLDAVINSDKAEIIEALNIVEYENIDFIDALLISKAIFWDYEILSFDKKLNKVYKKKI